MVREVQDVAVVQAPPASRWVMPSLLHYPATYLLIGINLAVYLAMCLAEAGPHLNLHIPPSGIAGQGTWLAHLFTTPFSEKVLLVFGSCVPLRVIIGGQWWRLVTSIFVHVTLLHLLLNMWCLWNLGLFGEPLLGRPGLVAVYLLTGIAGMLQSVLLNWVGQERDVIVAGASGAVFGLAGILIVLLSNRRLAMPWVELRQLRRQVIFFAMANLLLGEAPTLLMRLAPWGLRLLHLDPETLPAIDNSAHLGGLLCGLALGLPLFPRMASGRSSYRDRQAWVFGIAALLLALVSYAVASYKGVPR